MAKVDNTDPRLRDAAFAMYIANLDYEEHKGSSRLAPVYLEKFFAAQAQFRAKKAELEGK